MYCFFSRFVVAIGHVMRILGQAANPTCADCTATNPDWASINLGAVICIACSGIHRAMGTHITKVRSLVLDAWDPVHVDIMERLGNEKVRPG